MNWITRSSLICTLLCLALTIKAQDIGNTKQKTSTRQGFYLGAHVSTNGWGVNARYAFNDKFSVRTGYETLLFSYDFNFDENSISYDATLDYKTGGIPLLVDFSYTKNLYISAGVVFNSFNPKVTGSAVDDFEYGDIVIRAEDIGSVTVTAESGLEVSPYIGAGYQAFFGKSDGIVFQFETGLYYMGPPDLIIEADGYLAPTADPAFGQKEYLEYQFDAYKIYPAIKLSLAFKLF